MYIILVPITHREEIASHPCHRALQTENLEELRYF